MHDVEMAVSDSTETKAHILTSRHYENLVRLMVRLSEQYLRSQRKRDDNTVDSETPSDCVAEWTGDDTYFLRGRVSSSSDNQRKASADTFQRPSKRLKRSAPETNVLDCLRGTANISKVPDEILIAIFGSIPSARDRSSCASVCKRWLMLQTHMHRYDFKGNEDGSGQHASEESDGSVNQPSKALSHEEEDVKLEKQPLWAIGDLSRCLEGKKATDVRLASIAVGTGAHGGLGKLTIRGGPGDRSAKGVTDVGLTTIGICCNALRSLTLWDCPNVGDRSLESIGNGCRLLQTLDILKCPNVGDLGLQAIARGCLRLSSLSIDSCEGIGNAGLKAIAENCSNLLMLSLSRCPNIGNPGVVAVIQHCKTLRKLKLEKVGVSDQGLAFLTHHSKALTKLVLSGLEKVTQKGFISFTFPAGLKALKVLVLNGCNGVTDHFLSSFGKTCKELKGLWLIDCENVSDHGLEAFVHGCHSLKGLHIEKCNRITYDGLRAALGSVSQTLKTLHISKCVGVQDSSLLQAAVPPVCCALKSLSVTYCEGIGDKCLGLVGRSFPCVEHLDLSGITGLSDEGLSAFLESSGTHLLSLNLSECSKLTDEAIFAVARKCRNLQILSLDGCIKVTDKSVGFVASQCSSLQELDVSKCAISDAGIIAVAVAVGPALKTLSLSGCDKVTDESLPIIQRMCDSLSALNLKNCNGLTAGALESFEAELRHRCDILLP